MEKKDRALCCSFNSVRSQTAEGFLNARCRDRYTVFSDGIAPAGLNPFAVAVMKEIGIEISSQPSKKVTPFSDRRFDYVITLCNRVRLAVYGSIPRGETAIHREFASPLEIRENNAEILSDFHETRDEIDDLLDAIFKDCPKREHK